MSHDSRSSAGSRRPAKRSLDLDELGSVQLDNLSDISDGSDLQFTRGNGRSSGAQRKNDFDSRDYRRDDDSSRSSRSSRSSDSYRSRASGKKDATSYELKLDMLANQKEEYPGTSW